VKRGYKGALLAKLKNLLTGWQEANQGEFMTMQSFVKTLSDGSK
jgi:hypothetical protein